MSQDQAKDKIRKLVRLAKSTKYPEEQQTALRKAISIAYKYNLVKK